MQLFSESLMLREGDCQRKQESEPKEETLNEGTVKMGVPAFASLPIRHSANPNRSTLPGSCHTRHQGKDEHVSLALRNSAVNSTLL